MTAQNPSVESDEDERAWAGIERAYNHSVVLRTTFLFADFFQETPRGPLRFLGRNPANFYSYATRAHNRDVGPASFIPLHVVFVLISALDDVLPGKQFILSGHDAIHRELSVGVGLS